MNEYSKINFVYARLASNYFVEFSNQLAAYDTTQTFHYV